MQSHERDQATTKRMLTGDEGAFNEFYDTYYDRVFRFCRRRVDQEETVYDVVQQTMEKALKYLNTYRGEASLYTWLCQICRNELSSWFKRSGNDPSLHVSIDDNPSIRAIVESAGLEDKRTQDTQSDISELVHVAIDGLPTRYASVLELKYLRGLSVAEISSEIELSYLATESLLARSRRAFKSLLEDLMTEQHEPWRARR